MSWHIRSVEEDNDTGLIQFVPLVLRDSDHSGKVILESFCEKWAGTELILFCNFDIRILPAFYSIGR